MPANTLLPIILLAASRHPDPELRVELWRRIQDWVTRSAPPCAHADIVKILGHCRGTALEPFRLNEEDVRLAALLAQIAFSRIGNQTHFRIVSRETIGHSGGCVLARDLSYCYVERFAYGRITRFSDDVWMFAPAEEPASDHVSLLPEASCRLGESGLRFSAEKADFSGLGWVPETAGDARHPRISDTDLKYDLEANSTVGNAKFGALDIHIRMDDNGFSFSTRSPETLMRMMAHFLDGAAIRFDPGPRHPGRKVLLYKPVAPGVSDAVRGCIIIPGGRTETWLRFPVQAVPVIRGSEMAAIARCFAIPEVSPQILSEVLA